MKLNLPTTWTSQKMQALFLLTVFEVLHVKGGSQFSTCLNWFYDPVVNFASSIPDKGLFCCMFNGSPAQCANMSPTCPVFQEFRWNIQGQCNSIGQTKFCVMSGYSSIALSGNLCGGILGNSLPTNATAGTCPSYESVGNILSTTHTAPTFSWLCCDTNNCLVPTNINVTSNIANTNCAIGQYSMMCFNDSGAWTCTGSVGNTISDITQPIGDCVIQVVPNSATSSLLSNSNSLTDSLSDSSSSSTTSTSITTVEVPVVTVYSTNGSSSSNNNGDPNLITKIFVPVGTILTAASLYLAWKQHQQKQEVRRQRAEIERQTQENFELRSLNSDQDDARQRQYESLQVQLNEARRSLSAIQGYMFANAQNQARRRSSENAMLAYIEEAPSLPSPRK